MAPLLPFLTAFLALASASPLGQLRPRAPSAPQKHVSRSLKLDARGIPAEPTGVTTITSKQGATIRYKQPSKEGFCETKEGVNDYAGYISLDATTNVFFWFFEAREKPEEKPLTLWLNGGPGSDSLIGLFQEHGPCNITEDLKTQWNPYSWNEVSNMLYLSQPVGVGFSYETEGVGSQDPETGLFVNASEAPATGRWSLVDEDRTNTTHAAAVAAWHLLQAFLDLSPNLDANIQNHTFNLWTESYGGHYGPDFYNYFYKQNLAVQNGSVPGVPLTMDTLGVINGIVDERIQAPYYPIFAVNNTYGIKSINETIADYMTMTYYISGGCRDYIDYCEECLLSDDPLLRAQAADTCETATNICRGLIEEIYYAYGGRGVYDIRHPYNDPTPPDYFVDFLNQAWVQEILGVDLNYTATSYSVFYGFDSTGDFVYPFFKKDLEQILTYNVTVALIYGDADYICNWFGGEAVSLALDWSDADAFRAAGYAPFVVDGEEFGETRQLGRFSFTRVYESGHEVPYYQPKAALELFRRVLDQRAIADGGSWGAGNETTGPVTATHTESFVPLPTATASS